MAPRATLLAAVAALLPTAGAARAQVVSIVSARDTTIFQNVPANSAGGAFTMFAGTEATPSPRRALLAFDVAGSIPAGSVITSAQLTLTLQGVAGGDTTPRAFGLHRLLSNWGEGVAGAGQGGGGTGNGFPANTGDATWSQNFFNVSPWATAGGDFAASASAIATVSQTLDSSFTWASTSALVSDVQSWLDTPSSNFGWALVGDEAAARTFRQFYTREASNPAFRPTLVVGFTPVPEPSSLAQGLGVVAGLCGLRRRWIERPYIVLGLRVRPRDQRHWEGDRLDSPAHLRSAPRTGG
jgi:hypothetical protein